MSYILQALQKAATDRQRGQVPDLHQSLAGQQASAAAPSPAGRRRWPAGATAVVVALVFAGLIGLLADRWRNQQAADTETATSQSAVPSVMPAPTLASDETLPSPSDAEPPAPETVFKASAPILRPAPPSPPPVASAPTAASAQALPVPPSSTPTVAAATPVDVAGLSISGATYSDNPAHRMLIVNGQVVREGQAVKPGLTLEAISPNSAIFNQGGRRFNLNY